MAAEMIMCTFSKKSEAWMHMHVYGWIDGVENLCELWIVILTQQNYKTDTHHAEKNNVHKP